MKAHHPPHALPDFHAFSLPEPVIRGIEEVGFQHCTPIQALALPLALEGKDVAGQAQTGTGKTAAFLIAAFTRLLRHPAPPQTEPPSPRALIIAPTRELAVQITDDALNLGQFTGLTHLAVYGGIDYDKQREALKQGPDLLVGTPGRLIDYLKQRAYSLGRAEVLVIDEADRMFDMGFIQDLRFLLRRLPPYHRRQSFLFSATLTHRVLELAYEHMNNPEQIIVSPERITVPKAEQVLYHVGRHEKFSLLLGLLRDSGSAPGGGRILLFVNTKREAERLVERLTRNGYTAKALTGDVQQKRRLSLLRGFKEGKFPILVATDVASRGLHIEAVTHVINYDLPLDPEDYVHRIGRTARAGATGKAISLACEYYVEGLEGIEDLIGQKIPVLWPEENLLVKEVRRPHPHAAIQPLPTPSQDAPAAEGSKRRRRRKKPQPVKGPA
ncbi:MAG: DEAD/DEAH box helicase [Nitrospirae bacterium]|nr:DEAD/DEAH box helicase [Nitrospirota bacterium]